MFCSNCKSLMFPSPDGLLHCRKCGLEQSKDGEKQSFVMKTRDKEIAVVDEKAAILPKTKAECPKCGHNEAFFVLRQTRAADEPETRIYRCTKCEHSWREY